MMKRPHTGAVLIFALGLLLSALVWALCLAQIRQDSSDARLAQVLRGASPTVDAAVQPVGPRTGLYLATAGTLTAILLLLAWALSRAWGRYQGRARQLAASEALYRQSFDEAAAGMAHLTPDGRLLRANQSLARMLGRPLAQLAGDPVRVGDVTHRLDRALLLGVRRSLLDSPAVLVEARLVQADGAVVWALLACSLARQPDGSPGHVSVTVQDITAAWQARQALERDLHNCQRDLHQARVRLDELSHSVSNELRAAVMGNAGLCALLLRLDSVRADAQAQTLARRVSRGADQMYQMIEGLLALAGLPLGALRRETVDLSLLADTLLAQAAQDSPEREVKVEVQPGLVADADPRLMASLLAHLINNAWKFTATTEQARIDIGCLPGHDGQPVFYVHDNGAGFDMAQAARLFKVFQRLDNAADVAGLGVGLATAKAIVGLHQGVIWAQGTPGRGARLYFTLGSVQRPPDRPGPTGRKSGKIDGTLR